MNADNIRHLYEYHFALNRKFWHFCIENLSWKQLIGIDKISVGSIRNQFVHIMSVDERWFRGLRGKPDTGSHNPENFGKPAEIRIQRSRKTISGQNEGLESAVSCSKSWHSSQGSNRGKITPFRVETSTSGLYPICFG
jgi:uncharacterized damage-inducible protein DinB